MTGKTRKSVWVLGLTLAVLLSMLVASLAFADDTWADGDGLAEISNVDLNFGSVCPNTTYTLPAYIVIRRNGENLDKMYANEANVAVSALVTKGTNISLDTKEGTITLPKDWTSLSTGAVSDPLEFNVTIDVGSSNFAGEITFSSSGEGAVAGTNTYISSDKMSVSATIKNCSNTEPVVSVTGVTDGESYEIGAVPAATCKVTDKEDGSSSFAATLSAVSGPLAAYGLGSQTASCSYTDAGGSTASDSVTYSIVDTHGPTASPSITEGTPGSNGWYTSDVTVTWNWTDDTGGSGIDSANCKTTTTSSGEGEIKLTATCKDLAGNEGSASYTVKVDKTPPTITASLDKTPAATGWFNISTGAPIVSFTCEDLGSGLVGTCPVPHTFVEGAGQSYSETVYDVAGNSATASGSGINVDLTAPTIMATLSPDKPASTGWYNLSTGAPTVSYKCYDAGSSDLAGACPGLFTFGQGSNLSHSETIFDVAGNSSTIDTTGIKVDLDAPTASANASPAPNANGWNNTNVTVSFDGDDGTGSGIDSCDAAVVLSSDGAGQSASGTCTDMAGNVSASATKGGINIDKTAPVVTLAASGDHINNEWFTGDVVITTTCEENISGIVSQTGLQSQTEETAGMPFSGSCTNGAGLTGNATPLIVRLDKTAPVVTLAASGNHVNNEWFTGDVSIHTSGEDLISGVVSCTPDATQTDETQGATFNGSCTNGAGLTGNATTLTVKLDKSAPEIVLTLVPNPIILNGSATFTKTITDGISGVDNQNCGTIDNTSVGEKKVTCSAVNGAGLESTKTLDYSVIYATGGMCLGSPSHTILQPINSDGSSTFKQKSTVPAKFRVCDANGASIGTSGVVTGFNPMKSVSGTPTDVIDEAVVSTTPDTAFRWSSDDQQWIFNMNTKNSTANKTYYYRIFLNDGTLIDFSFGLK